MNSQKGKSETAGKLSDIMSQTLVADIRSLIFSARCQVTQTVNTGLTILNWEIGRRIRQDTLKKNERPTATRLSPHCGDNWTGPISSLVTIEPFNL
jgi:hypothetical protein